MNVSAIRRNTKEDTEIVISKCRDSENMDVDTKIKSQMTKVKIGITGARSGGHIGFM